MKKIIIIILGLYLLSACTRKYESSIPKDRIDIKQMENIVVDMYLLEASVRNCNLSNKTDSLDMWTAQQMNGLLLKYKITYSQFLTNYSYYMGHEKLSQELMEKVVDRLVKKETQTTLQFQEYQKQHKQNQNNLKKLKAKSIAIKINNKK